MNRAKRTRTFSYGYDNVGNRKWAKRDGGTGDVFGYDRGDQVSAVKLNIANPDTTAPGQQTIFYDANGNRTWFTAYGTNDQYTTNNLNQYTKRNAINAAYELNGNLTTGVDGSTYTYDAQNRVITANKSGVTATFKYDGLNRQVSRTVGGVTTYSAWDGWDLMQEYQGNQGSTITARYVHGATGLVKNQLTNNYYYQDGSGSTSHLTSSTGALLEWYRYDLQGTPVFYNAANVQISGSNQGVRHLFTGQQWYSELGLYDLRNRFYSPDIGRFLQPDPIGFGGDPTNLYRYCGNNPVNWGDPSGLQDVWLKPVHVRGPSLTSTGGGNWQPAGSGGPAGGFDFGTFSSGGRGHGGPGGGMGGRRVIVTRDAGLLGRSEGAPFSTQGFWTNMDGTITGIGTEWVALITPNNTDFSGIADLLGKILNLPNDIIGIALGVAGLPFGGERWRFDHGALEIIGNVLVPLGAITFGNVTNYGPTFGPTSLGYDGNVAWRHEGQGHGIQGQIVGPLYIPLNIIGGIIGLVTGGSWHAPGNFMEAGPSQHPPVPFPGWGH